MKRFEIFGIYSLFWIIFSLLIINLGFILGINISIWSLPATFFLYLAILYFFKLSNHKKNSYEGIIFVLMIPLIFFFFAWFFGLTFDSSYDGQSYHQTAVIELSNGWNPWSGSNLPIKLIEAEPFVTGYPKALWTLQSAIYKLYPWHINAATVTNLFISFIAFTFLYSLLRKLKLSKNWSIIVALFTVLQPTLIQEFFSFTADGFSYEAALIAIVSLINLMMEHDKRLPLSTFFASVLLLPATKYSNLGMFALLILVCVILLYKIIRQNIYLINYILIFSIVGMILLWVPYGKNFLIQGSPFYPSSLQWAKDDLVIQNIPNNLKTANKLELLFYGIYSKAQTASSADSKENVAILKIPFTTTLKELTITNNFQGRAGSEGVLFSGLFSLSVIIYITLLFNMTNRKIVLNRKVIYIVSSLLGLTFIAALLNPIPNELHYVPIFALIPIYILVALLLLFKEEQSWIRAGIIIFAVIIGANIILKIIPTIISRIDERQTAVQEMKMMKESNKIYQVHAKSFYSSYIRLDEYGIKFVEENNLSCADLRPLILSNYTTYYCP
jgi:hypothetical protein